MRGPQLEETMMRLQTFSATKAKDRAVLGERVTEWLRGHPELEVTDKQVLQSSDREFHCVSVVLWLRAREPWHVNHAPECGREYRGCAPDCPKQYFEEHGHLPSQAPRRVRR
jgi:hypothetical protein